MFHRSPFSDHRSYRLGIAASTAVSIAAISAMSASSEPLTVPMIEESFAFDPEGTFEFRDVHGRDALCLDGSAFIRDTQMRAGTISVDVANSGTRHFANVLFHGEDFKNTEAAYLRMHKSGSPDAVQYTPYMRGESNWQLMGSEQKAASFGDDYWVTLEVAFNESGAAVSVAGNDGALEIANLRLDGEGQKVGLSTLFVGCFSNLKIDSSAPDLSTTAPQSEENDGIISSWSLSPVEPFTGFPHQYSAPDSLAEWTIASTDLDGTLFVSRYRSKLSSGDFESNQRDLVYAGVSIDSEKDQRADFAFDVSDIGAIYLNGERLFQMDNSFRAKGMMFRGDFDRSKQVLSLPLAAGANELVIALAERANGWGLSGQLAVDSSYSVEPLSR